MAGAPPIPAFVFCCLAVAGAASRGRVQPALHSRSEIIMGEAPEITTEGLEPGADYVITAGMTDSLLREWRAEEIFRADASGRIDLAWDVPVGAMADGSALLAREGLAALAVA